jgi:predicted transcriptional regulator
MNDSTWHTGQVVKELADNSGMTSGQVADRLGISRASIYNYYNLQNWKPAHLSRAADMFGVRYQWLQDGTGDKLAGTDIYSVNNPRIERAMMLFDEQQRRERVSFMQSILRMVEEDAASLAKSGKAATKSNGGAKKAPTRKVNAKKGRR